jgi:FkbH-like protein
MKIFIYRNHTIELLFKSIEGINYSGYSDIVKPEGIFDIFVFFYLISPNPNETSIIEEIEDFKNKVKFVVDKSNSTQLFLFTIDSRYLMQWEYSSNDILNCVTEFNNYLYSLSAERSTIKVINISKFFDKISKSDLINWKYYYLSGSLLNPNLAEKFKLWFNEIVLKYLGNRKKCLVLDLDNTLWGGILGEDGINGIQIGNTYPGKCFSDFQQIIKRLNNSGIILAICSKNNEDDVWTLFDNHPDMVLKRSDFVAYRINWTNKVENIRQIADEINIGLDSLVFLDDNPIERESVIQLEPQITVPEFPTHPYQIVPFFEQVVEDNFLIYKLTKEDVLKNDLYKANKLRQSGSSQFANFEEYLRSLETVVSIESINDFNSPRIAQLTQKTNQFNLTTKRLTESDLILFVKENGKIYCAKVADKFGDNGITLAIFFKYLTKDHIEIDNYLLSCRVLGRNIEQAFLYYMINHLFNTGVKKFTAKFEATLKNKQVEEFYDNFGFTLSSKEENIKVYQLLLQDEFDIKYPIKIQINEL